MRLWSLFAPALATIAAVCVRADDTLVVAAPQTPIRIEAPSTTDAAPNELSTELIQAAVAADIQRTAALVAADTQALELLCGEELVFGHADGRIQSKAELLDALNAGEMRYFAINPGPREVRLLAEAVALVFGSAELLVGTAEDSHQLKIRYLAVYRRDARLGWRLTAYQSAPRTTEE